MTHQLTALLIHRLDNLTDPMEAAILNHYQRHLAVTGLHVRTLLDSMTVEELNCAEPTQWLRVALRQLADCHCLVTIDTINPDRHREVLRTAADACGHSMLVAEKYCPPFTTDEHGRTDIKETAPHSTHPAQPRGGERAAGDSPRVPAVGGPFWGTSRSQHDEGACAAVRPASQSTDNL